MQASGNRHQDQRGAVFLAAAHDDDDARCMRMLLEAGVDYETIGGGPEIIGSDESLPNTNR